MPRQFTPDFKERAVRLLEDRLDAEDKPSVYAATREIAPKLGIGVNTLVKWFNKHQINSGVKSGLTTEAEAEIKRLKRENAELRRANEILKTASAFFAAELDRPSTK